MTYAEFQEHFEQAANEEKQSYDKTPVEELLKLIRRGSYGNYYQIWHSVAERGSAAEAGGDLLAVLRSGADYLSRFHCAAALLRVLNMQWDSYFKPEKLSARERYDVDWFLNEVEKRLKTTEA